MFRNDIRLPKSRANAVQRSAARSNAIGARLRERAVLTFSCVGLASRSAARFAAAATLSATLSAMTLAVICSAAYADGMAVGGCVGSRGSLSCVTRWGEAGDPYVRLVPPPANEVEKARAAERDRKWEQRCRPIIMQDRYGVPRYEYAARGCEFGVIE